MNIEVKSNIPEKNGRAKHLQIDINKKKIDFPKKATHISRSNSSEVDLYKTEFGKKFISEFAIKLTPSTLRNIVSDSSKHQSMKDSIRTMLADTDNKSINIAFPMLVNQKNPNESDIDYIPFGKPKEKIIEKIYDLIDIEGFDILILPISSSNGESIEWVKMSTKIFKERHHDYLNEFILSGFVPRNVTENSAITFSNYYLDNGINSLSIDFDGRKVPESRMKNIINKSGEKWKKIHIHAVNTPHYDWYKWRKNILSTYDLLVSLYGFDSFGNFRSPKGGGEKIHANKIKGSMERKRYRIIDTYGTYNKEALSKLLENHTVNCNCPTCRKMKPIDIYEKPSNRNSFDLLKVQLKTHRLYNTHKETDQVSKMIDNNKYVDHLNLKKDSTNEINSIVKNLN